MLLIILVNSICSANYLYVIGINVCRSIGSSKVTSIASVPYDSLVRNLCFHLSASQLVAMASLDKSLVSDDATVD